jgi:glyoxylase-like metal-dependent hydrolase (beta-lactamase superfamily II)
VSLSYDLAFEAPYETLIPVAPRIRRLLTHNPSAFTFKGTGVYVIGEDEVAVVDPGPASPEHLSALRAALAGESIRYILVTHTHRDHSPAAQMLKEWSGAKIYAYGPHGLGPTEGGDHMEEGVDRDFMPDVLVRDGDVLAAKDFSIECVFTPGHTSNHMSYALREEKALFTGDHVMGWSSTVILPPDGDMETYLASLEKLLARDNATYWPTHGGPIRKPKAFVRGLLEHRRERERQILQSISEGHATIPAIVRQIYRDVDPRLYGAAGLSVLAHLVHMTRDGRVKTDGTLYLESHFHI